MKKKVIIFDMDGVLFDSPAMVGEFLLHQYPTVTKEIMTEALCGNFHDELAKIKLVHTPIQETPEEHTIRNAAYSARKQKAPLYVGVQELLQRLHDKGLILTINTSAVEKNCLPLLEFAGIAQLFDFVATKEVSKSKVEKFAIIEKKYGAAKAEMLFITDTLGDVREADVAGIPTVAVTYGAHDRTYFTREHHANVVGIVDEAGELEQFIQIA